MRARALVGKAAPASASSATSATSAHWGTYEGGQRLAEVMGRMQGGEGEAGQRLLERLLLGGDE